MMNHRAASQSAVSALNSCYGLVIEYARYQDRNIRKLRRDAQVFTERMRARIRNVRAATVEAVKGLGMYYQNARISSRMLSRNQLDSDEILLHFRRNNSVNPPTSAV